MEDVNQEQTLQFIKDDPRAFVEILQNKVIPETQNLLKILNDHHECKEFEMCLMDVESMLNNLTDYLTNGPSAPFVKVPLEDSEIPEDAPENLIPGSSPIHLVGE